MDAEKGLEGLRSVIVLWLGQLISLVGTGMTRFAMTIWVWDQTESATAVALLWAAVFAPGVFLSPVAGVLVDRWNRKRVLVVTDLVAGAATLGVLALFLSGGLEIWHLYLAGMVASAAESFQGPAQAASITNMVAPDQLARANGIMSLAQFGSTVLAPVLAGVLVYVIGIGGVLGIDIATFLIAVGMVLVLRIPQPAATAEGALGAGSIWSEMAAGLRYILDRVSLVNLMLLFTVVNLVVGLFVGLINPLILARSGENTRVLGLVLTINGIGGVVGGLLLSIWGGPKRRIQGVLGGMMVMNFLGIAVVGLGRSFLIWAVGAFIVALAIPVINGCTMAILQLKVAPDVQGRVFGVARVVAQAAFPLALVVAGPLADRVLEPAMAPGGALAPVLGGLVGTGLGSGMSVLLLAGGILGGLIGFGGFLVRAIREVETLLPDQLPMAPEETGMA